MMDETEAVVSGVATTHRAARPTLTRPRPDPRPGRGLRPRVSGRFLYVGDEKLWVRGVTYGTFTPVAPGDDGYDPARADDDFARMATAGINAMRLYTVPPPWLLDAAERHGLWVAVDIPWEEHITFLDQRGLPGSIRDRVREGVRRCAGHPAVLAFSIGNEIPSRIVRWHGTQRIEGLPGAFDGHGPRRGPGCPRHVRELPDDRVPARARARLRVVERLPRAITPPTNAMSRVSRTLPTTGRSSSPSSERTAVARGPTSRPS